ncbi:ABC transporter permease [Paenibacillus xerothermodurans]|uniref:Transport permease protein n=1 Tax=Paenibacillus xerothermodurans TaxID=1977292 RepID=A0A2W1NST3_PAEXE|nr:ABC transporter permease [Paenibacillus xerothermodurans]PZE20816.1 ABC transporter permease [Paenibacillus xerothermodurans]
MINIIQALWHYKGFIFGLVKRDFKTRYLNSAFGSIWAVLHPIALIFVYTVIFSQVMGAKLPNSNDTLAYSIYLCAGLLPWQLFSETIMRMQNVFLEQSGIMKKVSFPRTSLPVYILTSTLINFLIIYGIFMVYLLIVGEFPGISILQIIPLLVIQQIFAVGLGIILATLNVFFRDIGHSFAIVLQFWSWLTPIVYTVEIVPDKFKTYFDWNILLPVFQGYQSLIINGDWNNWSSLWFLACVSVVLLSIGYFIFKKLDTEMVDEL